MHSVAELLERLERARYGATDLALASDGDGTIWRGDIGEALFRHALGRRLLREEARAALAAEARAFGLEEEGDSHTLAERLFEAHLVGRYDEGRAFSMMAWCFAGWTAAELAALSQEVLDAIGFDEARVPAMRAVIAWAAERELPLWLVSASPEAVVLAAAARLGMASERVVAMRVREHDAVLLPELALAPSYAEGKLLRLRERTSAELLAAFGDSLYDLALLREARVAVGVGPNADLAAALADLPEAIVVDR